MIRLYNRFKHLFFALAIGASAIFVPTPTLTIPEADKEVVFLWDIHEVLLHKIQKWWALKHIGLPIYWPSTIFRFIKSGIKLTSRQRAMLKKAMREEGSTADLIDIACKEGNTTLAKLIIEIANYVKPVKGMEQLVRTLKNNGYRHFIGSNISSQAFDKLKCDHKKLFALFTGIPQVCRVDKRHADGRIIAKPDGAFYEEFLKANHIDLNTTRVIFIDDKPANIAGARRAGLEAIEFKNVKQLTAALVQKGIRLRPNGRLVPQPA